jgi:hypothetical protein
VDQRGAAHAAIRGVQAAYERRDQRAGPAARVPLTEAVIRGLPEAEQRAARRQRPGAGMGGERRDRPAREVRRQPAVEHPAVRRQQLAGQPQPLTSRRPQQHGQPASD